MKVGLILPSNIWFAPFVHIYTRLLTELNVEYDIISWNKDGSEQNGELQFDRQVKENGNLGKLWNYCQYANFVKRKVRKHKYDKLIVFCPQIAIFINGFLKMYYKGKYIFDYRDLSIEQKWYFKRPFLKVLQNSFANVISSPGFKRCLPMGFDYFLSHNFDVNSVRKALKGECSNTIQSQSDVINVLTIGGIRDFASNIEIVKSLANRKGFQIQFVGKGAAAEQIKEYAIKHDVKNISFEGYYPKEKEMGYIQQSSFLNIFYPRVITHDTALSNRFYNSLIFRKPMIVTKNTTQGDYAEKYNVGVVVAECSNLGNELRTFMQQDYNAYAERCDKLLRDFLKDQERFEKMVRDFIES